VIIINKLLAQATTVVPDDGSAVVTQTDPGVNWLWLLPLLAIPLILMAMRPRNDRERTTTFSGTKGGRSEDDEEQM
jgi:hypothetical protein